MLTPPYAFSWLCPKTHCRKSFACCLCLQNPWKPVVNVPDCPLESYIGQSPDAIIAARFRDTPEGKTLRSRNWQHYTTQIDAFQCQVAEDLRQQVQYGRVVRGFLIHNGVMLQAG